MLFHQYSYEWGAVAFTYAPSPSDGGAPAPLGEIRLRCAGKRPARVTIRRRFSINPLIHVFPTIKTGCPPYASL